MPAPSRCAAQNAPTWEVPCYDRGRACFCQSFQISIDTSLYKTWMAGIHHPLRKTSVLAASLNTSVQVSQFTFSTCVYRSVKGC